MLCDLIRATKHVHCVHSLRLYVHLLKLRVNFALDILLTFVINFDDYMKVPAQREK